MPDGKDILKTLIELLESQEQIKVEYEIGGSNEKQDIKDNYLSKCL